MATKKQWKAVIGLTLKDGSRVEPGKDYPGQPPKWLIVQGKVEAK